MTSLLQPKVRLPRSRGRGAVVGAAPPRPGPKLDRWALPPDGRCPAGHPPRPSPAGDRGSSRDPRTGHRGQGVCRRSPPIMPAATLLRPRQTGRSRRHRQADGARGCASLCANDGPSGAAAMAIESPFSMGECATAHAAAISRPARIARQPVWRRASPVIPKSHLLLAS